MSGQKGSLLHSAVLVLGQEPESEELTLLVLLLGELIDMKLTREEAEVLLMIFEEWEMAVEALGSDIELGDVVQIQDKLMDFAL
jgi:hypothetical protein